MISWCDCHIMWLIFPWLLLTFCLTVKLTFTWLLLTFFDFSLTHYLTFLWLFLQFIDLILTLAWFLIWLFLDCYLTYSWPFLTKTWLVSQFCSQKNRTLVNTSWLTFYWLFLDFSFLQRVMRHKSYFREMQSSCRRAPAMVGHLSNFFEYF